MALTLHQLTSYSQREPLILVIIMFSYTAVPEEEERFLCSPGSENESTLGYCRTKRRKSCFSTLMTFPGVLHWIAHGFTILLLCILVFLKMRSPTDSRVMYNAVYEDKPIPLHFQVFKAAFWEDTIFKAHPNPPSEQTLAAWDHITETPFLNLTENEVSRMGLSKDSVRWPKSAGGGYAATLEITHQLHCLRSIWMRHQYNKHPDHPMFSDMKEMMDELPDIADAHLEHCVDIIR
jgi:hypothetical protein